MRHIVCDSTEVKVYGDGEWKVRTHGALKRRARCKQHLQTHGTSGEILVAGASANSDSGCEMFNEMPAADEAEIEQIRGNGTFDRKKIFQSIRERGILKTAIPLRKGAKIWQHVNSKAERLIRDENLR